MTPQELKDYIQQYGSAMTPGGAASGTSQFMNSPGYNMQFGPASTASWITNPVAYMLDKPELSTEEFKNTPAYGMSNLDYNLPLNSFLNSDAYKLAYGNNNSLDPNQRFQNDQGVQMAIKAGMPLLANSYASKGLGMSSPAANAVSQYMYNNYLDFNRGQSSLYNQEYSKGYANKIDTVKKDLDLYNQEYNKLTAAQQQQIATYLNQQGVMGQNFSNYQDRLMGLAGQGAAASNQLSNNSFNAGNNLANLLFQGNMATGTNSAQIGTSSAAILAELLANQGVLNANALIGTGAAKANNMLAGSQLGAQIANAQNRTNAGNQTASMGGIGNQKGYF